MTAAEWTRLRQYFDELRELNDEDREAALVSIRLTEPAMAEEVRCLLDHDDRAGLRPIDVPVPERLAAMLSNPEAEVPPPADLTGQKLKDRYEVIARLASGGSSDLWLAHDQHLAGRKVVIKTPHSPFISEGSRTEIDALAGIHHPAIARPLDCGTTEDGSLFLVLEWVDGHSLRDMLRDSGRIERPLALRLIEDVAGALDEVHHAGVLHLDVKPENVMVRNSGGRLRAVLVDFGIASIHGEGAARRGLRGSPAYMAPERFEGVESRAADIYGLGLIALELLGGQSQEAGEHASRLAHLRPKALRGALTPALEADPRLRPQSAGTLARALVQANRRPYTWMMTAATTMALIAASLGLHEFYRRGQKEQELSQLRASMEHAQIDKLILSMDNFGRDIYGKQLLELGEAVDSDSKDPAKVRAAAETVLEAGMQYGHPGRRHVGMSARAEVTLRRAMELADRAVRLSEGEPLMLKLAARCRDALASVLIEEGRYEDAGKLLREALHGSEGVAEAAGVRAGLLGNLSRISFHNHEYEECLKLRNQFVEQRRAVWLAGGGLEESAGDYAGALATRGYLLREMGRYDDAMRDYEESDRLTKGVCRVQPQNQSPIWQLARNAMEEGRTLAMARSFVRAREYLAGASSALRTFVTQDPNDQATARQLALSLAWLAKAQKASGIAEKQWRASLDQALQLAFEAVRADPASAKAGEDLKSVREIADGLLSASRDAQIARK